MFAIVPPPGMCGGFPCFFGALFMIGVQVTLRDPNPYNPDTNPLKPLTLTLTLTLTLNPNPNPDPNPNPITLTLTLTLPVSYTHLTLPTKSTV